MPPAVLVLDDKPSVLELLASILGEYAVVTASDPAAALDLLRARAFDVVLTDIRMPGADGFEVLRAAKGLSDGPEVVMMTAYATVVDAVRAVRQGAYDYIAKPFQPDDVLLVVARAVECRRRARAGSERGGPEVEAQPPAPGAAGAEIDPSMPFREAVAAARDRASQEYLAALMRDFRGNVTHAAKKAGMTRISLLRLLKRYGVRPEDFRRRA
jgi:DNA-binding NtrC family response regulator